MVAWEINMYNTYFLGNGNSTFRTGDSIINLYNSIVEYINSGMEMNITETSVYNTSTVYGSHQTDKETLPPELENAGTGENPDGTQAHIGIYGGQYAWGDWGTLANFYLNSTLYKKGLDNNDLNSNFNIFSEYVEDPYTLIKKVKFTPLSSSLSYTALGGIRFKDETGSIIDSGNLIVDNPTEAENDSMYMSVTSTYTTNNYYYIGDVFDISLPQAGYSDTSGGYWLVSGDGHTITCEFKEEQIISEVSFNPKPQTNQTNRGITEPFQIEFYDAADDLVQSYTVEPITENDTVQYLNTEELSGSYAHQIKSSITIPYRNDLSSAIYINPNNYFEGEYDIVPGDRSDIDSLLNITKFNDLDSFIKIRPFGYMEGLVEVLEAPLVTHDNYPTKDTFVRSGGLVNYGGATDVQFGTNGEEFIGYAAFDLDIPESAAVESVKLKLNILEAKGNLKLYTTDYEWPEYGITWGNKFPMEEHIITLEEGYNEIDLMDWYDLSMDKISFGFQSDGKVRFSSKEGEVKPNFEVQYVDMNPKSAGRVDVDSEVVIRQSENSDLVSTALVDSDWGFEYFNSKMHVLNQNMVESDITVSKKVMPSNVKVRRKDKSEITGSLVVQQSNFNDLTSKTIISQVYLAGNMRLRIHKDLDALLDVTEFVDFPSRLSVSRKDTEGHLEIPYNNNIDGLINLRIHNDLISSIALNKTTELDSSILVVYSSMIDSYLYVNSPYLHSSLSVGKWTDNWIYGRMEVIDPNEDLASWIGVVNGFYNDDFECRMKIRPFWVSDLSCYLKIGYSRHISLPRRTFKSHTSKQARGGNAHELQKHVEKLNEIRRKTPKGNAGSPIE